MYAATVRLRASGTAVVIMLWLVTCTAWTAPSRTSSPSTRAPSDRVSKAIGTHASVIAAKCGGRELASPDGASLAGKSSRTSRTLGATIVLDVGVESVTRRRG